MRLRAPDHLIRLPCHFTMIALFSYRSQYRGHRSNRPWAQPYVFLLIASEWGHVGMTHARTLRRFEGPAYRSRRSGAASARAEEGQDEESEAIQNFEVAKCRVLALWIDRRRGRQTLGVPEISQ